MSKSRKTNKHYDDYYEDGFDSALSYEEYRSRKKEHRIERALKTRNINELIELEEWDED
jgi:hypothetical protein